MNRISNPESFGENIRLRIASLFKDSTVDRTDEDNRKFREILRKEYSIYTVRLPYCYGHSIRLRLLFDISL